MVLQNHTLVLVQNRIGVVNFKRMNFTITEAAISYINTQLDKRGKGVGILISVYKTGCSGLAYKIEYTDEKFPQEYLVVSQRKFDVFIAPSDQIYFEGATLDYAKEKFQEGLKFINPNEKNRCGCGKSINF